MTNLRASGYLTPASQPSKIVTITAAGNMLARELQVPHAVGIGINSFCHISQQVARIAIKDPKTELKLTTDSHATDHSARLEHDTIHVKVRRDHRC